LLLEIAGMSPGLCNTHPEGAIPAIEKGGDCGGSGSSPD
jgi:hypothetical protein